MRWFAVAVVVLIAACSDSGESPSVTEESAEPILTVGEVLSLFDDWACPGSPLLSEIGLEPRATFSATAAQWTVHTTLVTGRAVYSMREAVRVFVFTSGDIDHARRLRAADAC